MTILSFLLKYKCKHSIIYCYKYFQFLTTRYNTSIFRLIGYYTQVIQKNSGNVYSLSRLFSIDTKELCFLAKEE